MLDWILRTRGGAWTVALAAAAGLLALGWGLAHDYYAGEMQRWQEKAAHEASRANRLAAEARRMEERLALSRRQGEERLRPAEKAEPARPKAVHKVLHRGQAAVLLGGRVVLTLEKVTASPKRVRVRVKVLDGREGVAVLGPGQNVSFRLGRRLYHLVVKQVHTSSATFAIVPQ